MNPCTCPKRPDSEVLDVFMESEPTDVAICWESSWSLVTLATDLCEGVVRDNVLYERVLCDNVQCRQVVSGSALCERGVCDNVLCQGALCVTYYV